MTEHRTKGIILRRRNVGEADRLYSILTLSRGKVTAKAKGVRRVTSRQSGHLEPFYLTSFHLVSTPKTLLLTQSQVEEDFPSLHANLKKIGLASGLIELTDKVTEENQPVPALYDLLFSALELIEKEDKGLPKLFRQAFELKLMNELGYRPELDQCVVGEEKYPNLKKEWQFSINLGGLVCPDHQNRYPGIPISRETIRALKEVLDKPLKELADIPISLEIEFKIKEIGRRFLEYHLDPRLKSVKVAKDLQG